MFKSGDSVVVCRPECTVRHRDVKKDGVGDSWITSKPKAVEHKGVVGSLQALNVVVNLPGGDYKGCKYVDLTFLKSGKVSFSSKKADWKGIKKGKEVLIPGKPIRLVGTVRWTGVHVPITFDNGSHSIPYEQLKFKKEIK